MASLPPDYLERVYAGVLGKLIGVYLGRPFEGWTHQRIMQELGPIRGYVHEKLKVPLLVTDDDVSGTFTFIRALEEHGVSADLDSEHVGLTWLNNIIEGKTILWWGGRGVSTEHTAFLNLKDGTAPAPQSGSADVNGTTVAEQIGAQIFIDGWALVAPGRPDLAARLAEEAARVSHDGIAVHAAKLWAAMEAEAFSSKDVQHLLETGLSGIPPKSPISRLVNDIRAWAETDRDWLKTRQRIEDVYGYDKYGGNCHVVPNHAVMIMSLIYGGDSFHEAMHIVNTSGWDTDCNSGNVGCLLAIMHGMAAFEHGPDWRGPLADMALISSADGGYSINNAARLAIDVANLGRRLAGKAPLDAPKGGAQYHFTLPGSVQGFRARGDSGENGSIKVEQASDANSKSGLAIRFDRWKGSAEPVEVTTPTFAWKDVLEVSSWNYHLMSSPLVYPGQRAQATLRSSLDNTVTVHLRLRVYSHDDVIVPVDGPSVALQPRSTEILQWTIPDTMDSQPIQQIGFAVSTPGKGSSEVPQNSDHPTSGTLWLESLGWTGTPCMTLRRPSTQPCKFWQRAWVQSADHFHGWMTPSFTVANNREEGLVTIGNREWTDYSLMVSKFTINLGHRAGIVFRVCGVRRYYALVFEQGGELVFMRVLDNEWTILKKRRFPWKKDLPYDVYLAVKGGDMTAEVGDKRLAACDYELLLPTGGVGLMAASGSVSAESITVGEAPPCKEQSYKGD